MQVLSLFSGIGGLDLGLEAHGCKTVAYSEIDPYASRVMAERFPDAVNVGDITTIDWGAVNERFGRIDIICGGFPCQDISFAGKGAGIAEGTRSGLWAFYADAVRVLRPGGVLVENVAAILSRGIDRVLGDLAACGYDAEWDCIPASAVGAPHRRDRAFVIAYPTREQRPPRRCMEQGYSWRPPTQYRGGSSDAFSEGWRREKTWNGGKPNVGRLVHGVPNRVHRLRCLGNAVVPQVAEHVAGILLDRIGEPAA